MHSFDVIFGDPCRNDDDQLALSDKVGSVSTDCIVLSKNGVAWAQFSLEDPSPLGEVLPALISQLLDAGLTVERIGERNDGADRETIRDANAALRIRRSDNLDALKSIVEHA